MMINNRYHHKLYDGLASCLTKLSEFDQAIEVYKQIFQREEGKKKWDAQRSIKFVNKLKRKKALGALNAPAASLIRLTLWSAATANRLLKFKTEWKKLPVQMGASFLSTELEIPVWRIICIAVLNPLRRSQKWEHC